MFGNAAFLPVASMEPLMVPIFDPAHFASEAAQFGFPMAESAPAHGIWTPDRSPSALAAPVFQQAPPILAFPSEDRVLYGYSGEYFSPSIFYPDSSGQIIQSPEGAFFSGPHFPDFAREEFLERMKQMERELDNSFLPKDCSDCVHIDGLPEDITKEQLAEKFKAAGTIRVTKGTQRIFLFLDRMTKRGTGRATITFVTCEDACCAIRLFNQKPLNPSKPKKFIMTVRIATPPEKNPFADKLRREHFETQQVMDQLRLQNQVLFQLHEQQISPTPTHSSFSPPVPKLDSPAAKKEDKKVQRNGFDKSKAWYEKKNNKKNFRKNLGTPKKFASS